MSSHTPAVDPHDKTSLSRRRFLGVAAGIGAAAATPLAARSAFSRLDATAAGEGAAASYVPASSSTLASADRGDLIVVAVQLEGGNDALNTVVPLTSSRYRDLRGGDAITEESTIRIDDEYGLFAMPYLASQWDRGDLGIVHGVGYQNSSLSHFEDTDVWERGSTDASTHTGWLGRALDSLTGGRADPLIAMTVGALSPSMQAPGWAPVTLPEYGTVPWTAQDHEDWRETARAFDMMVQPDRTDSPLAAAARSGHASVFDLADLVGPALADRDRSDGPAFVSDFDATDDQFFPGEQWVEAGELGEQLGVIADLVNAGLPTRAYHVYQGGYDTHADQAWTHPQLIRTLDLAIEKFHKRLGDNANRVVLVTWTEFGRRPEWNGSGTDHGTAGVQFVVGPRAVGGHHGEAPSLDSLDRDDNFQVTTDFRSYLGGIVEGGLGVAASDVFDTSTRPLEVIA